MNRVSITLLLMFAAISALAATYRVDIDDASRVKLYIDLDKSPLEDIHNGLNTIDMGASDYLRIVAETGVIITEATKIDDYYNEEIDILYQVGLENGQQYIDLNSRYPDDEWFRIRTSSASDTRTAQCTVNIDVPERVSLTRKATGSVIELQKGENIVKFDPKSEAEFYLEPIGKPLFKVTHNETELSTPYAYTIPVADGDRIDIQAAYPDNDCNVTFSVSGAGVSDFIQEVDVDSSPCFDWMDGITVKCGSEISIKGNTKEYEVLAFEVDGNPETFTNPTKILITDNTDISVSVRKYASFEMQIKIDDPSRVHVYRGYSYNHDELTLQPGLNTVEITRNIPIISLVPVDGNYINTLNISGDEYEPEELMRAPVMVGSLTDGDLLDITTAPIVRDKKFVLYISDLDAAAGFLSLKRSDMSEVELVEGYNVINFFDRDNPFRLETGGPVTTYVYYGTDLAEPEPGGYTYIPQIEDGTVVKAFVGSPAAVYEVDFQFDYPIHADVLTSNYNVYMDMLPVEMQDVNGKHNVLEGTVYEIESVDGAVNLVIDDDNQYKLNAGESKLISIFKDTKIALSPETVGVDQIESEVSRDVQYFNLQGQKITAPEPGTIVIEVSKRGTRKGIFTR